MRCVRLANNNNEVKIEELLSIGTVENEDYFLVADMSDTSDENAKKVSASQVKEYIVADINKSYIHTQSTPSAIWNIQHNLSGTITTVIITDITGEITHGEFDFANSTNNLYIVKFAKPIAGKAFVKL